MARHRSAFWACSKLASRTSVEDAVRIKHLFSFTRSRQYDLPSGKSCPKWMIVSKSLPRQLGSSHLFTTEQEHTISHYYTRSCSWHTSEVVVQSHHTIVPQILSLTTHALLHITIAMKLKQSCVCMCVCVCVCVWRELHNATMQLWDEFNHFLACRFVCVVHHSSGW